MGSGITKHQNTNTNEQNRKIVYLQNHFSVITQPPGIKDSSKKFKYYHIKFK